VQVLTTTSGKLRTATWLLAIAIATPLTPVATTALSSADSAQQRFNISRKLVPLGPGHYAIRGQLRPRRADVTVKLKRQSCRRCDWETVAKTATGSRGRYHFRIDAPSRRTARYRIKLRRADHRLLRPAEELRVEPMEMSRDGVLPYWGVPSWRDEFKGSAVDADKWRVLDNTYVSYDDASLYQEQAQVRDGKLVLTAKRIDPDRDPFGREWASAYLDTRDGRFGQRYGRFEIMARIPTRRRHSSGLWPSFWLRDDHGSGEIDVMEAWGTPSIRPGEEEPGNATWTIHSDTMGGGTKVSGWSRAKDDPSVARGFYKYAVEWTPDGIEIFVNDKRVGGAARSEYSWLGSAFPTTANMRLQLAVGSDYWGPATTKTETPASYVVEYVRVWEYPDHSGS
jgi:beta-glucanase (GH16 family)